MKDVEGAWKWKSLFNSADRLARSFLQEYSSQTVMSTNNRIEKRNYSIIGDYYRRRMSNPYATIQQHRPQQEAREPARGKGRGLEGVENNNGIRHDHLTGAVRTRRSSHTLLLLALTARLANHRPQYLSLCGILSTA